MAPTASVSVSDRPGRRFRLGRPRQIALLRWWHAWLAGGFLVAWLTGDEDTYTLHQFSGYAVLAAFAARAVLAWLSAPESLLRWPHLSAEDVKAWLLKGRGRNPLFAGLGLALLVTVGLTAASGAIADWIVLLEHPHEFLSDITLMVIVAHIAFILYQYGGKQRLRRWIGLGMVMVVAVPTGFLTLAAAPAEAADPAARQAILDGYRAEITPFGGFDAARGEALYRATVPGKDPRISGCTSCHTDNPRQPGQNAKTGRGIDPVAVSVNPDRFTDPDRVEKQFSRDCKTVLNRACTAQEKGDYITFLMGQ